METTANVKIATLRLLVTLQSHFSVTSQEKLINHQLQSWHTNMRPRMWKHLLAKIRTLESCAVSIPSQCKVLCTNRTSILTRLWLLHEPQQALLGPLSPTAVLLKVSTGRSSVICALCAVLSILQPAEPRLVAAASQTFRTESWD